MINDKNQMSQSNYTIHDLAKYDSDEIKFRDLFLFVWQKKWWIIVITAVFAIASVFYALSIPNEYKATAVVAPASESGGGGLNALAGQLGGLASLAGVNLGNAETTDTVVALELLQSWGFADNFIKKYNLQVPLLGVRGWDRTKKEFIYNENIYNSDQKKWIREAPKGKTVEPTSWELYEKFRKNISISQDNNTGLIKISFSSYSPEYSQIITENLIQEVNEIMKERALKDASKNIDYLQAQINRTPLSDMKNVFYSLIQEQTKTKMLAEVSEEYAFMSVSRALVPEEKSKPRRAFICISITLFGFFLSLVYIFLLNLIVSSKRSD